MHIDFSRLETDFQVWLRDHVDHVRETQGEGYAYAVAVELEEDPWQALQWFVEDRRKAHAKA